MFLKKPATTTRPQAPDRMAGNATFSIIGADVSIKGDIEASADLHVDGHIEGDISCAALVQGESSTITGAIITQSARLAGTVNGTISSQELVILKTAKIEGDVRYDSLTIEQGAQVEGRLAYRTLATDGDGVQATDAHPVLSLTS